MVKKTNYLKKRKNMSNKKKSYPRKLHHKRSLAKKNKSKKLHRKISYRKKRTYRRRSNRRRTYRRNFKGGANTFDRLVQWALGSGAPSSPAAAAAVKALSAGEQAVLDRKLIAIIEPVSVDDDPRLWKGAKKGDAAAIERLVAEGANPDAKNKNGWPAVVLAAQQGHAGAVSALVWLGADLAATDSEGWIRKNQLIVLAFTQSPAGNKLCDRFFKLVQLSIA